VQIIMRSRSGLFVKILTIQIGIGLNRMIPVEKRILICGQIEREEAN